MPARPRLAPAGTAWRCWCQKASSSSGATLPRRDRLVLLRRMAELSGEPFGAASGLELLVAGPATPDLAARLAAIEVELLRLGAPRRALVLGSRPAQGSWLFLFRPPPPAQIRKPAP